MLVVLGILTHGPWPGTTQTSLDYPGDSAIYAAMVTHGPASAPVPYRYRLLTPWLARLLPWAPMFALAVVNLSGVWIAYVFGFLTCRRLGYSVPAAVGGVLVAYPFVAHAPTLYGGGGPYLTDGLALGVIAAMLYAYVADRFGWFVACALIGALVRETPVVILAAWLTRDVRRGGAALAVALGLVQVERAILGGSGGLMDQIRHGPPGATFWPGTRPHDYWHALRSDLPYTWGWAFALIPAALVTTPPAVRRQVAPVSLVIVTLATAIALLVTDVGREFSICWPVIVIAAATVIAALMARGERVLLAGLAALVLGQWCLSDAAILSRETWTVWSVQVPLIKIGVLWVVMIGLAFRRPTEVP
jgi:hypothetical protein